MADEQKWDTGPYGTPGQLASEGYSLPGFQDDSDEINQLHGEFAEVGSPADEEATKLRVNELVVEMDAETDPAKKLILLTNFVLAERITASEVAARLVVKRGVKPEESFVESMEAAGAYSNESLKDDQQ